MKVAVRDARLSREPKRPRPAGDSFAHASAVLRRPAVDPRGPRVRLGVATSRQEEAATAVAPPSSCDPWGRTGNPEGGDGVRE